MILIDSPVGPLTLDTDADGALTRLSFGVAAGARTDDHALPEIREQLDAYFNGARAAFDLPLALSGTPWEMRVWDELQRIPYGETRSYGEVAAAVTGGTSGTHAARAVGRANHCNRIAIVVPCHRVVGADGKLIGFAGGLDTKRRLLDLEAGRLALI